MNKIDKSPELGSEISTETIENIMNDIGKTSLELATKLDKVNPGDFFGLPKHEYLTEIANNAEKIGSNLDLSANEIKLFKIILRSHDIGRHQEIFQKLSTLRPGIRHGAISVEILEKNNILEGLTKDQKQIIYDAVKYHAEKTVDLDSESLAYKLCYILRDFDKKEIIDNEKYLSVKGIFEQLNMHYFEDNININYQTLISELIELPKTHINKYNETETKLKELLNKGINPKTLEDFLKQESTTVQDIKYSYATYMLFSISFIFDVSNNDILVGIVNSPMFQKRLDFIKNRVAVTEYEQIISTIINFVTERLGEDINVSEKVNLILGE